MVVDLPAPLGPSRPRQMPFGTSRSRPSTAVIGPNLFTTPCSSIAAKTGSPDYELDMRRTDFPDLWTDVQGKSRRARLAFALPGSRQEARSRHAAHPPAQHHRRPVEPERRLAGHGRPHPAVELPVR